MRTRLRKDAPSASIHLPTSTKSHQSRSPPSPPNPLRPRMHPLKLCIDIGQHDEAFQRKSNRPKTFQTRPAHAAVSHNVIRTPLDIAVMSLTGQRTSNSRREQKTARCGMMLHLASQRLNLASPHGRSGAEDCFPAGRAGKRALLPQVWQGKARHRRTCT